MNMETSKGHLEPQDRSMLNGLQKWRWVLIQVYHGLCASNPMLLIQWSVPLIPLVYKFKF